MIEISDNRLQSLGEQVIVLKMILIVLLSLSLLIVLLPEEASAQDSSETEAPLTSWNEILLSGAIAATISAAISAIVNYKVTLKQIQSNHDTSMNELKSNHENAMKQLSANYENTLQQSRLEKQAQVIEEKLNLYSAFLYQLKMLMSNRDQYLGIDGMNNLEKAFHEIDSLLSTKFYLLNTQAINDWVQIRGNYMNLSTNDLQNALYLIRDKLRQEYNHHILMEFKNISGNYGVDEIPPD